MHIRNKQIFLNIGICLFLLLNLFFYSQDRVWKKKLTAEKTVANPNESTFHSLLNLWGCHVQLCRLWPAQRHQAGDEGAGIQPSSTHQATHPGWGCFHLPGGRVDFLILLLQRGSFCHSSTQMSTFSQSHRGAFCTWRLCYLGINIR